MLAAVDDVILVYKKNMLFPAADVLLHWILSACLLR
jgi:hypothetical protein